MYVLDTFLLLKITMHWESPLSRDRDECCCFKHSGLRIAEHVLTYAGRWLCAC